MSDKRPGVAPARFGRGMNLTDSPILPTLLKLAWPVIMSNLMQTAYNIADTFWLGRLGPGAVAAISLSFPIVFLFISVAGGFTVAGTTLVAQNIGAGRKRRADHVAGQTLLITAVGAVCISIVGFLGSTSILALLGAEPGVLPDATAYLQTWFLGVPFVFGSFLFTALLQGFGDTINPMKLMVASTFLNILLDPCFIFGWWIFPELGVQGAAVATVIARGTAAITGIWLLFKGRLGLKICTSDLRPDWSTIGRIARIGAPSSAEMSVRAVGMTTMTGIVARFGTPVVAAFGIGNRINSVVFMPSQGLAAATTSMVGQNLGANKPGRAKKATLLSAGIVLAFLTTFGVVAYLYPESLAAVFLRDSDVVTLGHATAYLRTIAFSFGCIGVLNVFNGAFRGAGRTVTAMVLSFLSLLLFRVPLAYVLANHTALSTQGLWWGVFVANVAGALAASFWFSRGYWQRGGAVIQQGPVVPASAGGSED